MRRLVLLGALAMGCSSSNPASPTAPPPPTAGAGAGAGAGADASAGAGAGAGADAGAPSGPVAIPDAGACASDPTLAASDISGKSVFVAVGQDMRTIVSPDGTRWGLDTRAAPPSDGKTSTLTSRDLVFGNGTFVMVGDAGGFTSADAVTWTKSSLPVERLTVAMFGADNRFVVLGSQGLGQPDETYSSTDGMTWTMGTFPSSGDFNPYFNDGAFGNGRFVAVGGQMRHAVSDDGVTWHDDQHVDDPRALTGVAFGNGVFVAVGTRGASAWSTDGVAWNDVTTAPELGDYAGVAFGNGVFLACAWAGCSTSADGKTWTHRASFTGPNGRAVFGGGMFVALGWPGEVYRSSDGAAWSRVLCASSDDAPPLDRIVFAAR